MLPIPDTLRHNPLSRLAPAASTALLWCAAAAGGVYWVLHFPRAAAPAVADAAPAAPQADADRVARALGQASAQPVTSAEVSRYQLLGVIASTSGQGSALIAVDGQAPKAFRVGQAVEAGVSLNSVTARQARLQAAGAANSIELTLLGKP